MTTRAVISCSEYRDYTFSLPLAALFWREVVGFEPLLMLTESEAHWRAFSKRNEVTLTALKHFNFDFRYVGHMEGYETPRVGQNARHYASCYDLPEDDWLLVSDADLWPLNREFYYQRGGKATCLYFNGDHFQGKADVLDKSSRGVRFQTIPTCHIIMRVKTWRELYNLKVGDSIPLAIKTSLDQWMAAQNQTDKGFAIWMVDQDLVTVKLCQAPWFPSEAMLVSREGHPPKTRLDRGNWSTDFTGMIDAHIFKEPDSLKHWGLLREVVKRYLPHHLDWADNYQKEYRASYEG